MYTSFVLSPKARHGLILSWSPLRPEDWWGTWLKAGPSWADLSRAAKGTGGRETAHAVFVMDPCCRLPIKPETGLQAATKPMPWAAREGEASHRGQRGLKKTPWGRGAQGGPVGL